MKAILLIIFLLTYQQKFLSLTEYINAKIYFSILLLMLSFVFYENIFNRTKLNICHNEFIIIIFLLLLPFVSAIGTTQPLWNNSYLFLSPWFLISLILLCKYKEIRYFKLIFIFSLIICFSVFIYGYIFIPYSIKPLTEQTEIIESNDYLKGFKVDINTKKMLNELKEILKKNNFQKNDPMVILGSYLGIIYVPRYLIQSINLRY